MLELSYNFRAVDSPSTKINGQTNETYSAIYIYINIQMYYSIYGYKSGVENQSTTMN